MTVGIRYTYPTLASTSAPIQIADTDCCSAQICSGQIWKNSDEILKAFEAHLKGDRSINIYDLFRAIAAQTAKGNKAFIGKPLEWESDCLRKWHRQFKYGVSMTPLSDYDTRQRVHILLTSNLLPFEGSNEPRYKQTLLRRNSHLI